MRDRAGMVVFEWRPRGKHALATTNLRLKIPQNRFFAVPLIPPSPQTEFVDIEIDECS